jgi:hypothetical protein
MVKKHYLPLPNQHKQIKHPASYSMLHAVILSVVMLTVAMKPIMLSAVVLTVVRKGIMLSVIMLTVALDPIMLTVVTSCHWLLGQKPAQNSVSPHQFDGTQ